MSDDLTSRERDILGFLTMGWTTRQISKELFLSEGTVKSHLTAIYRKLGVTNRTEAAVAGVRRSALPLEPVRGHPMLDLCDDTTQGV
jgi:DNA-binding NarL/FixJ family response regulator